MLDIGNLASGVIGAFVGAAVSGFFTLRAVRETGKIQRQAAADASDAELQALLQAIHDELETVFEQYQSTMGVFVEALPQGSPLNELFPVSSDYFTIFNSNAARIGAIPDPDLRKALVRAYVLAKALVDTFRMNNELINRREHFAALAVETGQPLHQQHADGYTQTLVAYADSVRNSHNETKAAVTSLLRELRTRGVLQRP